MAATSGAMHAPSPLWRFWRWPLGSPWAQSRHKLLYDRASTLAGIGMFECDVATDRLVWTDGVYDLFGIARGAAIDRRAILPLYDDASRREVEALRTEAIRTCGRFRYDAHIQTVGGSERWMRLTVDTVCDKGRSVRIFGVKQDISEERALQERLKLAATLDPLTGLANRGAFELALAEAGAGPERWPAALILVDVDGFKQINDRHGHLAGDACLKELAARLRRFCPTAALVARIGGDEFALLIDAPCPRVELEERLRHLIDGFREPIPWRGRPLRLSASLGVAIPRRGAGLAALVEEADRALYAAKAAGRNTIRFADSSGMAAVVGDPEPVQQSLVFDVRSGGRSRQRG